MARITCYLPDDTKALWERLDPPVSASEILRRGILAVAAERGQEQAEPAEPVPA